MYYHCSGTWKTGAVGSIYNQKDLVKIMKVLRDFKRSRLSGTEYYTSGISNQEKWSSRKFLKLNLPVLVLVTATTI